LITLDVLAWRTQRLERTSAAAPPCRARGLVVTHVVMIFRTPDPALPGAGVTEAAHPGHGG